MTNIQSEIQKDEALISGLEDQVHLIESLLEEIKLGQMNYEKVQDRIDDIRLNLRLLADGGNLTSPNPFLMRFMTW